MVTAIKKHRSAWLPKGGYGFVWFERGMKLVGVWKDFNDAIKVSDDLKLQHPGEPIFCVGTNHLFGNRYQMLPRRLLGQIVTRIDNGDIHPPSHPPKGVIFLANKKEHRFIP